MRSHRSLCGWCYMYFYTFHFRSDFLLSRQNGFLQFHFLYKGNIFLLWPWTLTYDLERIKVNHDARCPRQRSLNVIVWHTRTHGPTVTLPGPRINDAVLMVVCCRRGRLPAVRHTSQRRSQVAAARAGRTANTASGRRPRDRVVRWRHFRFRSATHRKQFARREREDIDTAATVTSVCVCVTSRFYP